MRVALKRTIVGDWNFDNNNSSFQNYPHSDEGTRQFVVIVVEKLTLVSGMAGATLTLFSCARYSCMHQYLDRCTKHETDLKIHKCSMNCP